MNDHMYKSYMKSIIKASDDYMRSFLYLSSKRWRVESAELGHYIVCCNSLLPACLYNNNHQKTITIL